MNIDKINKKLKKISLLLQTFEEGVPVSSLERDLILSHIRDLYESILDNPDTKTTDSKVNTENTRSFEKIDIKPQPVQRKAEIQVPQSEIAEKEERTEPLIEALPVVKEIKEIVSERIEPVVAKSIESPKALSHLSAEVLEQIFKDEKVNELSDKLSMSHIDDIRKGLGLNERLFTQKELFGDNSSHFNEVMDALNKVSTYNEAKTYLLDNVIPVYSWDSESKIKKAATFVKLVKRRFI